MRLGLTCSRWRTTAHPLEGWRGLRTCSVVDANAAGLYNLRMDYQLILLIGAMVVGLVVAIKRQMWTIPVPGRPANQYQNVISATAIGLLFFVSGLLGWDLSYSHGWFQGTQWVDGPVWWQIGLGSGLLAMAGFLARRLPSRPTPR